MLTKFLNAKKNLESIWKGVIHKLHFKIGKWNKNFKVRQLVFETILKLALKYKHSD